jgi:hypothetical protein
VFGEYTIGDADDVGRDPVARRKPVARKTPVEDHKFLLSEDHTVSSKSITMLGGLTAILSSQFGKMLRSNSANQLKSRAVLARNCLNL